MIYVRAVMLLTVFGYSLFGSRSQSVQSVDLNTAIYRPVLRLRKANAVCFPCASSTASRAPCTLGNPSLCQL